MRLYTRRGDDGTTGLFHGGRVGKDDPAIEALGAVDEAQAAIGAVRAELERGSELDHILIRVERDLYVLMAELATPPEHRDKLRPSQSLMSAEMVSALEATIDDLGGRFPMPTEFVVPGQSRVGALCDVARTVVRRAERAVHKVRVSGSHAGPYVNRLSTLMWVIARAHEHGDAIPSRHVPGTPEKGS